MSGAVAVAAAAVGVCRAGLSAGYAAGQADIAAAEQINRQLALQSRAAAKQRSVYRGLTDPAQAAAAAFIGLAHVSFIAFKRRLA